MKVGHVPLISYASPGDPKVGDMVAAAMKRMKDRGTPLRAAVLDRLRPSVWHRTPAEAMATLEELEETARLWLMLNEKPVPLSDTAIYRMDWLRVSTPRRNF